MTQTLKSAESYYAYSARLASRAVEEAARAGRVGGPAGMSAAVLAIMQHQGAAALEAPSAAVAMLAEQGMKSATEAAVMPLGFVTPPESLEAMIRSVEADIMAEIAAGVEEAERAIDMAAESLWTDWRFDRLVASMVQEAARDAQHVDLVTRPWISHVRHLNLPSCRDCVALAGRIYKWSTGFQRHPGCDCVMIPTTLANESLTYDPAQLAADGQVTGLSRADLKAIELGADYAQVVNVRRGARMDTLGGREVEVSNEGITVYGRAHHKKTGRNLQTRLTPKTIMAVATDRDDALRLLKLNGYIS